MTTSGPLFPISSSWAVPAARGATDRPVWVDPTNATAATRGWPAISSPTTGPGPGRKATAPGGRSASAMASTSTALQTDVVGAGVHTTVLPAARAGAMTWAGIVSGQFHGVMTA